MPPPICLQPASDLLPQVERVLARVLPHLGRLLPQAEVEHIGATAIPGALTKGDLDLVLRVPAADFQAAAATLAAHYSIKQPENWTPAFASFGDDIGYPLPLGLQLVVRGSELDFLTWLRDHLRAHPAALAEYNRLKTEHAAQGAEAYWQAKDRFFTRLLAERRT